jgi:hypothetical protein
LMFVAPLAESFLPEHFYFVAIAIALLLLGVSVAARNPAFPGSNAQNETPACSGTA